MILLARAYSTSMAHNAGGLVMEGGPKVDDSPELSSGLGMAVH